MLFDFIEAKLAKKVREWTHTWFTGGTEVKNLPITSNSWSVAILVSSVGTYVPQHPQTPRLQKVVSKTLYVAVSFTDMVEQFYWQIQNYHYQMIRTTPVLSSLGLLWAVQLTFKVIKIIQEVSTSFRRRKAPGKTFSHL
jgi:hypothetical protein